MHLQEGSLEQFLAELGVPHDKVDATVQGAIVWRVTPAGRPLIDRRRRSRVERNVHSVTEHLVNECNLTKGPHWSCQRLRSSCVYSVTVASCCLIVPPDFSAPVTLLQARSRSC